MPIQPDSAAPDGAREKLLQMNFAYAPTRVLMSALQLGIFSHLAAGNHTATEVARAAEASERGTRMLLDALVGFELLSKRDGRYELTPLAKRFLVRESPEYLGYMLETERLWEAWGHLTEIVRTGRPYRDVTAEKKAGEFFPILIRSLHVTNREPAVRLAKVLGEGTGRQGRRVLDVACGSGVWSIAIAEADGEARVTALDFPAVLKLTREFVARHGLAERFDYLPGDLKQADFGEHCYDLALLGNVVHSEGERSSRDLFRRLSRALRPGGRIAIIDAIPNDERTGPVYPLIFALNMLVNTEAGDVFTLAQYTEWLKEAGFPRIETADIGSHSPAIVATKL